jgi:hypothetical protein
MVKYAEALLVNVRLDLKFGPKTKNSSLLVSREHDEEKVLNLDTRLRILKVAQFDCVANAC